MINYSSNQSSNQIQYSLNLNQVTNKHSSKLKLKPESFENYDYLINYLADLLRTGSISRFNRIYKIKYGNLSIDNQSDFLAIGENLMSPNFGPSVVELHVIFRSTNHKIRHSRISSLPSISFSRQNKSQNNNKNANFYQPENNQNEIFSINIQNFQEISVLGKGSYGRVTLCSYNNNFYAVKESIYKTGSTSSLRQLKNELLKLYNLSHPNIIQYYYFAQSSDNKINYMAMEYLTKGSIADIISKNGPVSIDTCRKYAKQILSALTYVHERKIVHRDIKCENCLLNEFNQVKLSDFGLAEDFDLAQNFKFVGTLRFMGPEYLYLYLMKFCTTVPVSCGAGAITNGGTFTGSTTSLVPIPNLINQFENTYRQFYNLSQNQLINIPSFLKNGTTASSDIWAFAITILQMLIDPKIFKFLNNKFEQKFDNDFDAEVLNNFTQMIPSDVNNYFGISDPIVVVDGYFAEVCVIDLLKRNNILVNYCGVFDLMRMMLKENPECRPSVVDLVDMEFFQLDYY